MSAGERGAREGWVDPELASEFPQLGVEYVPLEARPRRTPPELKERLRELSNRLTGPKAIHMRQDPVPGAYRAFYRQVGIDPDSERTPVERIALERLAWGGLRSRNLVDDALTVAIVETGVPVIALDRERVGQSLGLRLAEADELLGGSGRPLSSRQIVLADEQRALVVLFGEIAEERRVTTRTEGVLVVALRVEGVPRISVEEALWTATELLAIGA